MSTGTQTYGSSLIRVYLEELTGFPAEAERELAEGGSVELVRGEKVIAEMRAPESAPAHVTAANFDWAAQLKEMWGDRVFNEDTTAWIREDRDARG